MSSFRSRASTPASSSCRESRPCPDRPETVMLSIGDLVLDVTIVPDRRIQADGDTPAQITVGGGGQAANFCAWAASLGEAARLVCRVGDDATADRLISDLEAEGVEVCAVRADEPTGVVAVFVGPEAERTMATM